MPKKSSAGIGPIEGFEKLEVAGAGYINARVKRAEMAAALLADERPKVDIPAGKILVEHSSINPNKAAHIGHLRNAILGDTFVRLLRFAGREVDVQNYIDNTGVQVADVVVGFLHLEKKSRAEIEQLAAQPRFDYYCWDLYARVSQWYEQDKQNLQMRLKTLHEIEAGRQRDGRDRRPDLDRGPAPPSRDHGPARHRVRLPAARERNPAPAFLGCGVRQVERIGRAVLRERGQEQRLLGDAAGGNRENLTTQRAQMKPQRAQSQAMKLSEEDQKVIVRSNGTVGYVGKDIAYHMWKFGLLGRDFGYRKFYRYPNEHQCWISATEGETDHPHFGDVAEIYNVIDARQSEAQNTVIEALRGLGYNEAADHYTHFLLRDGRAHAALRGRTRLSAFGRRQGSFIHRGLRPQGLRRQGRRPARPPDRLSEGRSRSAPSRTCRMTSALAIATQIAIGALRYFMLKFTKPSVIAFDFKEALSFRRRNRTLRAVCRRARDQHLSQRRLRSGNLRRGRC